MGNTAVGAGVPLSILDLVPISQDSSAIEALDSSFELAQFADEAGYSRYWYGEHHNSAVFGTAATVVLIEHAASLTSRIRVGAGGIMLPNHAPIIVAEQFGTLVALHGNRIDLGLGRAPGTDRITSQALRRTSTTRLSFREDIFELDGYFKSHDHQIQNSVGTVHKAVQIHAVPASEVNVPLWVLVSSPEGGKLAGELGLPIAVASHIAPQQIRESLDVYRRSFSTRLSTAAVEKPYVIAGINVLTAASESEARFQFSTSEQLFVDNYRGTPSALRPPIEDVDKVFGHQELDFARSALSVSFVGAPKQVAEDIKEFVRTGEVDELIVVTYAHDPKVRLESYRLLAEAWGLSIPKPVID